MSLRPPLCHSGRRAGIQPVIQADTSLPISWPISWAGCPLYGGHDDEAVVGHSRLCGCHLWLADVSFRRGVRCPHLTLCSALNPFGFNRNYPRLQIGFVLHLFEIFQPPVLNWLRFPKKGVPLCGFPPMHGASRLPDLMHPIKVTLVAHMSFPRKRESKGVATGTRYPGLCRT